MARSDFTLKFLWIYVYAGIFACMYVVSEYVESTCNYKKVTYSKQIGGKLLKKPYFLMVSYLKGVFEIIAVKCLYNMHVHNVKSNWVFFKKTTFYYEF